MTSSINEKRRFHRITFHSDALLKSDTSQWNCEVLDLSLNGCLLRFSEEWLEDRASIYILELSLSEEIVISMEMSVAHQHEKTAGFKCEYIDFDSFSNLSRLIELNLGDSQLLEQDLLALAEIKKHQE
ncbi:MAG: PilZ domain-containing protein [Methylovulum sp.]|jgi:hypothetical protein